MWVQRKEEACSLRILGAPRDEQGGSLLDPLSPWFLKDLPLCPYQNHQEAGPESWARLTVERSHGLCPCLLGVGQDTLGSLGEVTGGLAQFLCLSVYGRWVDVSREAWILLADLPTHGLWRSMIQSWTRRLSYCTVNICCWEMSPLVPPCPILSHLDSLWSMSCVWLAVLQWQQIYF